MNADSVLATLFAALLPLTAVAQEEPEEAEPRNHAAAFVGATTSTERDETDFTLGGDYLRRLGERWSLGVFAEAVFAEHTHWVLGPQVRWHVRRGLWVAFEPVVELAKEESEGEHEPEREARALFRIGSGYDFEVGKWSVGPNFSVDVSREKPSWVFGVNVGQAFGSTEP
jgi:hypothetical protein